MPISLPLPIAAESGRVGLEQLRTELRIRMAMLEEQERIANEQLRPRSLEDIEMLERKLNEALAELQAEKGRMEQGDDDA